MPQKLPIGIQSFESLRKDGYLYVDKTSFLYALANSGKYFFLARPRRFIERFGRSAVGQKHFRVIVRIVRIPFSAVPGTIKELRIFASHIISLKK